VRDRLTVLAATPPPEPFPIGLCVRRADLRRPLVAALWSLTDVSAHAADAAGART
jgi:LysR family transcriptional regulator, positive regulator for ilvC